MHLSFPNLGINDAKSVVWNHEPSPAPPQLQFGEVYRHQRRQGMPLWNDSCNRCQTGKIEIVTAAANELVEPIRLFVDLDRSCTPKLDNNHGSNTEFSVTFFCETSTKLKVWTGGSSTDMGYHEQCAENLLNGSPGLSHQWILYGSMIFDTCMF